MNVLNGRLLSTVMCGKIKILFVWVYSCFIFYLLNLTRSKENMSFIDISSKYRMSRSPTPEARDHYTKLPTPETTPVKLKSSSEATPLLLDYDDSDDNECCGNDEGVKDVVCSPIPEPGKMVDDSLVIPQFHHNLISPREDSFMHPNQGGSKIAFVGKPGTGKSVMMRYIMYTKRKMIPVAVVMSGTESSTGFYSRIVPDAYIHNDCDQMALENFKERQLEARKRCVNPWALLVLDDCSTNKKNFTTKIQEDLFKNGRHYKMLYLVGVQYPKDIPLTIRTCFDGVFLFRTGNMDVLKRLWEYAGDFPNKETFYRVFNEVTSVPYRCLYIDYQSGKGSWYNNIYWAMAPPPSSIPSFRFGCLEYRMAARERVDKEKVKSQCAYDVSAVHKNT
ncbi:44.8 kDa ATPase [Spodoptera frugiperda ascovirus 1a]|uniref:44.8 kDa ATPase n=1 Tax=Spodoptera frugiperda ascovirus 1a TaxID=113370 RepID=Q0E4Z1_SFAVA|nr:44.8 kDa ATPase [Spodoptera frugiperda ascovirus 1a]CAL44710.1 44.8 kDa ATPase [Spodoptera frugiperda ascovirus 1a]